MTPTPQQLFEAWLKRGGQSLGVISTTEAARRAFLAGHAAASEGKQTVPENYLGRAVSEAMCENFSTTPTPTEGGKENDNYE